MHVTLTIVKGPKQGRVFDFQEPRGFIIGRAKDADLRLPEDDPFVARRHVFLEICPPNCRLQNLGSTNPPHVNGEIFTERNLVDGDVLELGYTHFQVSISTDMAVHTYHCRRCGKELERYSGEPELDQCPACIEKDRPLAPSSSGKLQVRCSCGIDLTKQANSDGRAQELHEVVSYACERCAPRRIEDKGTGVGAYDIRSFIGKGAYGSVYLVYHTPTARVLALKRMQDLSDASLVKRFEREMHLQKTLAHRNVLRVIETGVDTSGHPFLVTEYVQDGDLEALVTAQRGRLSATVAIPLICDVLKGLAYIHPQSIIHRDIKPSNILIQQGPQKDGSYIPKLADFGLAMSYARAGGTRLTKRDVGMGTLMYTSPEQVQDARGVREPADVYSVGVTLYYLLTGQYSFDFPTPGEIEEFQKKDANDWKNPREALGALMRLRRIQHPFNIILTDEPTPIRQRDSTIPPKLAEVVDRAVQKNPQTRFQSADEFRHALLKGAP